MNSQSEHRYAIRLPDSRCLGRYSIRGDIVPVPPVFAHIFKDLAEGQLHLNQDQFTTISTRQDVGERVFVLNPWGTGHYPPLQQY